jgi:uncharacterized protein involved in response to NO
MASVFIPLQEPRGQRPVAPRGVALWALGFRPFYLLAAALAALSVPLWALQFSGLLKQAWLQGPLWHAHEMVFGYTLAVLIGFLFTAGRNWSGQATPAGRPLMALAALWLVARVLVLTPWGLAAALANVAVPLWAAVALGRALHAGGNRRNYFLVGLMLALSAAAAVFHLAAAGRVHVPAGLGLPLALDVVLFIIVVMTGRVLPMFTRNGAPGAQPRSDARLERLALGSVLVLAAADALQMNGLALAALCAAAGLVHAARSFLWKPWQTWRHPLVAVLHAACLWLPVHLVLRAAAAAGFIATGPATHALTVGLIGTLTLGMITRTALGHTGQPLRASRIETAAYLAVTAAAVLRVALPLAWPAGLMVAVLASALLWSLAFVLYLWRYAPLLLRPRADGQPG